MANVAPPVDPLKNIKELFDFFVNFILKSSTFIIAFGAVAFIILILILLFFYQSFGF